MFQELNFNSGPCGGRVAPKVPGSWETSVRSSQLSVRRLVICVSVRVCVFVACVLRKPHDAKDVNCSRVAEETGHVESPEKRQEEPAFKIS